MFIVEEEKEYISCNKKLLSDFVQKVQNAVTTDLEKNGLELESVSLTGLDQTDKKFFNADSAFDAQGLTRLTETIEIANQDRDIAIAENSKELSRAETEAQEAEAQAVAAEEKVVTAKETEIANRNKEIAVIKATEEAEQDAVGVKVSANARKVAADDEAEAIKTQAMAEAESVKIKARADEERYRVEAEGKEKFNEAENMLSEAIIKMRLQLETIRNAAKIIEASVKPIEAVEGMKIINIAGLNGMVEGSGGATTPSNQGNVADQLINSLLKYRGLAPVVASILKEAGIDGGSIEGLSNVLKTNVDKKDD